MSTHPHHVARRYRVVGLLGEGAMARVYDAEDLHLRRPVAVKVLHPHVGSTPTNTVRFQREVEILRRLAHPGVVTLLDAGRDPDSGQLYLVTERLEGTALDAALSDPGLSRLQRLRLVQAALPPLAAAHQAGVVHRDLKPANIFVVEGDPEAPVKLLDFGIACLDGGPQATLTETTVGTPHYMAPEQATTPRQVGPAADLWSVGVMLYRVVAGALPFEGDGAYETVIRACVHPHPALPPGAPERLRALVDGCLAKAPEARLGDAGVVADALAAAVADPDVQAYLRDLDAGVSPPPALAGAAVRSLTVEARLASAAVPLPAPRRRAAPWLGAAAVMGAFLLVAALALWAGSARDVAPEADPSLATQEARAPTADPPNAPSAPEALAPAAVDARPSLGQPAPAVAAPRDAPPAPAAPRALPPPRGRAARDDTARASTRRAPTPVPAGSPPAAQEPLREGPPPEPVASPAPAAPTAQDRLPEAPPAEPPALAKELAPTEPTRPRAVAPPPPAAELPAPVAPRAAPPEAPAPTEFVTF